MTAIGGDFNGRNRVSEGPEDPSPKVLRGSACV